MENAIDSVIAPPRSNKFSGSREIYLSGRYSACVVRAGLVVQSLRTGTGKLMPCGHAQYADYVECIESAIDKKEGDALCRALFNP
jgi:hypothetical protein